jgi:hypothetical protein
MGRMWIPRVEEEAKPLRAIILPLGLLKGLHLCLLCEIQYKIGYLDTRHQALHSYKEHKGPVKGLRASGPQGPDPLFTHLLITFIQSSS